MFSLEQIAVANKLNTITTHDDISQFPPVVSCHLYLWKWTDKVVISDVDGTITKYVANMLFVG